MKCLIADLVVELNPDYEETKTLAKPFLYSGSRPVDITLSFSREYFQELLLKRQLAELLFLQEKLQATLMQPVPLHWQP